MHSLFAQQAHRYTNETEIPIIYFNMKKRRQNEEEEEEKFLEHSVLSQYHHFYAHVKTMCVFVY